jgi:hypothetical protein
MALGPAVSSRCGRRCLLRVLGIALAGSLRCTPGGGKRGVSDLESRSRGGRRTGQRERRLGRLALPGEMFPFELKVHIQVFHGLEHELLTLAIYCFAVGWVMPAADLRS